MRFGNKTRVQHARRISDALYINHAFNPRAIVVPIVDSLWLDAEQPRRFGFLYTPDSGSLRKRAKSATYTPSRRSQRDDLPPNDCYWPRGIDFLLTKI